MKIYCCNCQDEVECRLTNGKEVYPHREDLWDKPFWKHDVCKGHVGCHHKTNNPTAPLGYIPTQEIKNYRRRIHLTIDHIWSNAKDPKKMRKLIYKDISSFIGREFHNAKIKSNEEGMKILLYVNSKETQKKWQELEKNE